MNLEKRIQTQVNRLKKMGWTLLILAALSSGIAYLLPNNETNYWLSTTGKEGMFVLSTLFVFLGFYCFGAVSRKRSFF